MKTYAIQIKEELITIENVQAENEEQAIKKVKEMYRNEEIILTADDYSETFFTIYNN